MAGFEHALVLLLLLMVLSVFGRRLPWRGQFKRVNLSLAQPQKTRIRDCGKHPAGQFPAIPGETWSVVRTVWYTGLRGQRQSPCSRRWSAGARKRRDGGFGGGRFVSTRLGRHPGSHAPAARQRYRTATRRPARHRPDARRTRIGSALPAQLAGGSVDIASPPSTGRPSCPSRRRHLSPPAAANAHTPHLMATTGKNQKSGIAKTRNYMRLARRRPTGASEDATP